MTSVNLAYTPDGAVLEAFMDSTAAIKAIMGPYGSGKTTACLFDRLQCAQRMLPSPIDGIRRYKLGVLRDTYRRLRTTVIPTWHNFFPPTIGKWSGDEPSSHIIPFDFTGDGKVDLEFIIEFRALGEQKIEDVVRGWEITDFYINEADLLPATAIIEVSGRWGRYPAKIHRQEPFEYGGVVDFNAPDTENHMYTICIEDPLEGLDFFRQPSGFSADAENLSNLAADYYNKLRKGKPGWWVRRFIENEFGYSREGMPVYPEFNDQWHVADHDLEAIEGLTLYIGGDAGRSPAVIIGQRMANGQWRWLDEICATNMGARTFGKLVNKVIAERYPAWSKGYDRRGRGLISAWGDPAADYAGELDDEETWLSIMTEVTGFPWRAAPCPGNNLTLRLEAVREPLNRNIDGQPGLLLSPRCRVARKGFNSTYRYKRIRAITAGGERFHDTPEKNEASHPHDAGQYMHLGGGEYYEVMGRKRPQDGGALPRRALDDDDPEPGMGGGRHARALG